MHVNKLHIQLVCLDFLLANGKGVLLFFAVFCVVLYVSGSRYTNEGAQRGNRFADVDHCVFQVDLAKFGTSCGFYNGKIAFFQLLSARVKVVNLAGRTETDADDLYLFFICFHGSRSRCGRCKELFVAQFGHRFFGLGLLGRSCHACLGSIENDFCAPLGKLALFLGVAVNVILLRQAIGLLFAILLMMVVAVAVIVFLMIVLVVVLVVILIVFGCRVSGFFAFLRCTFALLRVFSSRCCCCALFLFLVLFAAAMTSAATVFIFTACGRCVLLLCVLRGRGLVVVFHIVSFLPCQEECLSIKAGCIVVPLQPR